jgi:hypothetical protein
MSRAAFLKRINYLLISLLTYFKESQLIFRDQLRERHLLLDEHIVFFQYHVHYCFKQHPPL